MLADGRLYIATLAMFAIAFFLQPRLLALRMSMMFGLRAGDLFPSPSFRLFSARRVGITATALALSFLAPTLFGMSVFVPLLVVGGLLALTAIDGLQIYKLASSQAANRDKPDS